MKKRKVIFDVVNNRLAMTENLHEIMLKLQSTGDIETVFKAVKDGRNALQGFFKESGLNADSVVDEMDKVRDALVNVDEIQTALSERMFSCFHSFL
jgi:hypothetical protein